MERGKWYSGRGLAHTTGKALASLVGNPRMIVQDGVYCRSSFLPSITCAQILRVAGSCSWSCGRRVPKLEGMAVPHFVEFIDESTWVRGRSGLVIADGPLVRWLMRC